MVASFRFWFKNFRRLDSNFMERWSGVLKVTLDSSSRAPYRVGASLCLSLPSKTLTVPSLNAIFFNGDRVEGTGNPVIEKLSDLRNITEILVSKLGVSINAWVVESSVYNGPFAVYKDFIPSVNSWGDPKSYSPYGFPASTSIALLLSKCLEEQAKRVIPGVEQKSHSNGVSTSLPCLPKTLIFGFSKGGVVLNQLVTELAYSNVDSSESLNDRVKHPVDESFPKFQEENLVIPRTKDSLLNRISEIHYVDVGLNTSGAYLTDHAVIKRISERLVLGAARIRFVLHGTPRQWSDKRRPWIRNEKDQLRQQLEDAAQKSGGKLQVSERMYFSDKLPDLQMHFEIIEKLDMN
ncbi:uncharacterized protein LOC122058774 isoform X3 [Macadamia integrifolia]|uniref:uncharacterized protein LOC122058774 isoform X3 n=1 Tax=Macadamia integrifolia TaxID=60698 RepID=UPI001C532116|nr:uncharacterized protein LOC122058774 isoform X3 [Macadamia integrifolia]